MARRKSRIKEELKDIKREVEDEFDGIEDAVEMPDPNFSNKDEKEIEDISEEPVISFESNVIDMTSVKNGYEHEIISKSIKDEFDPNSTQDALSDTDNEGGIYSYRSTGGVFNSNNQGGLYQGKTKDVDPDKVELSGFKVIVNFGNGDQGINVNAIFNDINIAKASINGNNFIFFDDGVMRVGRIVSGAPVISNSDREIAKFVNGEWSRV